MNLHLVRLNKNLRFLSTIRQISFATNRKVIIHPECDPLASIQQSVMEHMTQHEQVNLQALIIEELRRLHEGVLARYGLRMSEYTSWKAVHGR